MPGPKRTGLSDNAIGATAYFTPFMALFYLAIRRYNKRPYVRFHAWQSLLLNVFAIGIGYILYYVLPYLMFLRPRIVIGAVGLLALFAFLVWLWCVIAALNGHRYKLPLIGEWSDEQAYR